jgi:hypothetical protein
VHDDLTPMQHSSALRQGGLHMYAHLQGKSIVGARRADEATGNTDDSVAKYQERTSAV